MKKQDHEYQEAIEKVASDLAAGDMLALSRRTDWRETSPGVFVGLGQRLIATDNGEFALMDIRSVVLEPAGT